MRDGYQTYGYQDMKKEKQVQTSTRTKERLMKEGLISNSIHVTTGIKSGTTGSVKEISTSKVSKISHQNKLSTGDSNQ